MTTRNYFGMLILLLAVGLTFQYFHGTREVTMWPVILLLGLASVGGWLIDESGFPGLVNGLKSLFNLNKE